MLPPSVEFKNVGDLTHAVKFGKWEGEDLDNIFYDLMEKGIEDSELKRIEKQGKKYKAVLKNGKTIVSEIPCVIPA